MKEYRLLPYTAIDGIPTFTDSFIRGLFERMDGEGLAERVFYDGAVTNPDAFLAMMKHGMNRLFVIEFRGEIAGCCWLNNFASRRGEFHFCFFDNLRGQDAVGVGRDVVCDLLYMEDSAGNPIFDLLFGMTEVANKPAEFWCRKMGFEYLGIIPSVLWNANLKKSVPAHFWYVERGNYGRQ
jgi:hypothetical protein